MFIVRATSGQAVVGGSFATRAEAFDAVYEAAEAECYFHAEGVDMTEDDDIEIEVRIVERDYCECCGPNSRNFGTFVIEDEEVR